MVEINLEGNWWLVSDENQWTIATRSMKKKGEEELGHYYNKKGYYVTIEAALKGWINMTTRVANIDDWDTYFKTIHENNKKLEKILKQFKVVD